jgi:hypothetical protein
MGAAPLMSSMQRGHFGSLRPNTILQFGECFTAALFDFHIWFSSSTSYLLENTVKRLLDSVKCFLDSGVKIVYVLQMELPKIIIQLRGKRTQEDFAAFITAALPEGKTVSKQAVSQWETGATEPSEAVREILGIRTQFLITEDSHV